MGAEDLPVVDEVGLVAEAMIEAMTGVDSLLEVEVTAEGIGVDQEVTLRTRVDLVGRVVCPCADTSGLSKIGIF